MNRILKTCGVVLAALFIILPLHAKDGIIRGSYVNLRKEAKFNSPIVSKKMRGDTYKILFEEKNWLKVSFADGTEGWLYRTLIEKTGEKKDAVAKDDKKTAASAVTDPKKQASTKSPAKTDKASAKSVEKPVVKKITAPSEPPATIVEVAGTAEELYNEAIRLYEKKKYTQALEKNQVANKKAPQNAEILNNIGNCQFKLGRIEDALVSWQNALKISPRSGKICNNLGIAFYQLDKNKEAIEYYKKAILFEPDFSDPYYNLASVYGFSGHFEDAVVNYRKFLELSPDSTMKKLAEERIVYCERQIEKNAKKNG